MNITTILAFTQLAEFAWVTPDTEKRKWAEFCTKASPRAPSLPQPETGEDK